MLLKLTVLAFVGRKRAPVVVWYAPVWATPSSDALTMYMRQELDSPNAMAPGTWP